MSRDAATHTPPSAAPAGRHARWRLAVLSDIHGNLAALRAVLDELDGCDAVVNLGDALSGPLWPAETAALLQDTGWPTLAGNHERQLLAVPSAPADAAVPNAPPSSDAYAAARIGTATRRWLAALPAVHWLRDDVLLCHGTPASDHHYLMETVTAGHQRGGDPGIRAATPEELAHRLGAPVRDRARLVLCGHTHVPRVMQCGHTLVVNPGSVGLPAFDDTRPHPHRVETGSPHARWALLEFDARTGWQVQLRCTAYDSASAAAQAEQVGRADWAHALRTGVMGPFEGDVTNCTRTQP